MSRNLFSKQIDKQTLAEQMADHIKEMILSGILKPGEKLPTEPELSEQFGVSRMVVRDASRILLALGLVDVRQGSGAYVTESQSSAFNEALLIALRRAGATVWDVEQFQQVVIPEVIALAASAAADEEILELRERIAAHSDTVDQYYSLAFTGEPVDPQVEKAVVDGGRGIMRAIFEASHNKLFTQLAEPLLMLRNMRNWEDSPEDTAELLAKIETLYYTRLVDAIESRKPEVARAQAQMLVQLAPEAIEAMKETPVGERPMIPISISDLYQRLKGEEAKGD